MKVFQGIKMESTRSSSNKWDKNLVPRLFTSYCKLLYDCFKSFEYLLKKSFLATPNVACECSRLSFAPATTCFNKFSELWNLVTPVTMGKMFSMLLQGSIYVFSFKKM